MLMRFLSPRGLAAAALTAAVVPVVLAHEAYARQTQAGDVVINEFMADNEATASDQDGEFDDWIEFYNNTDAPISLSGYYVSDDGDDLVQWAFPDTSIAAGGYLIVWADGDDGQDGLHTNFGLSRNGETLYLTLPDGSTTIDEVTFGEQSEDISTGRSPNGTGGFGAMTPSFDAENIATTLAEETELYRDGLTLAPNYPNPFSDATEIAFSLEQAGAVSLTVYNSLGQRVATLLSREMTPGDHSVKWTGDGLASGLYLYTLRTDTATLTRTMNVVR